MISIEARMIDLLMSGRRLTLPDGWEVKWNIQNNHKTYGSSYANTGIPKYQDAERIVSCVNNCAGIIDEAEEYGSILFDDEY